MKRVCERARLVIVMLAVLVATGCSVLEPRPDTSRYFFLRSSVEPPAAPALADLVLGLGPVTLPDYLDRHDMLELVGPYELKYSADNRWIEPLGEQVRRTLADDLGVLLSPNAIVSHPWFDTEGVTLQAQVAFDAIRLDEDGSWRGSAEWVLRDARSAAPLERSTFDFVLGRDALAPEAVASGLSGELARLAAEIAAAVRSHHSN